MSRFETLVRRVDERGRGIDLPLMSVSQFRGVIRRSELADGPPRAESLDDYKICRTNDIVFNKMSIRDGAMGVSAEDGLVTYHYEVMRPHPGVDPRFVTYLMKSHWFTGELIKRERGIGAGGASGVRTTEVPFSVLRTIDAPIPDPAGQTALADFLDHETAQIDALIEAQRDLVARLTERRAALIAEAVLLGEDPLHLPREPRVPFAPLGYGFSVTLGKMLDAGRARGEADSDLPYLRAANIQDAGLALDDVKSMPFSPTEARMLDLRAGDVVVVEGGAVGTSLVLNEDMPGWSFQKTVNRLRRSGDWEPKFASYVLQTYRDTGVIDAICNKSTIPHLTAEKLRSLQVPAPDPQRQKDIVRHLNRVTARIDVSVQAANDAMALMQERRAALISAAVTGQIDPRTGKEATRDRVLEFA